MSATRRPPDLDAAVGAAFDPDHPPTAALIAAAADLISAVRAGDGRGMVTAAATAGRVAGDRYRGALGLAVLLAAGCDDHTTLPDLIAWTADRDVYDRLRSAGAWHDEAAALIAGQRRLARAGTGLRLVHAAHGPTAEDERGWTP